MKALKLVVLALLFAAGVGFSLAGSLYHMELVDKINRWLPEKRQIPILFANHRAREARRIYREMFPDGALHRKARLAYVGTACMLVDLVLGLAWFGWTR